MIQWLMYDYTDVEEPPSDTMLTGPPVPKHVLLQA